MKLAFLDIDGVFNFENHYKSEGFTGYRDAKKKLKKNVKAQKIYWLDYYRSQINFDALKRFERVCDVTGCKVVISSTWRHGKSIEDFNTIFRHCGLEKDLPIIDKTPHFHHDVLGSIPRGCEIKHWLSEKGYQNINWSKEEQQKYIDKSGIENYIIIDDDSDMLYNQRNHFVHVLPFPRNSDGFTDYYMNMAIEKLSKSVIELNYDN